MPHPRMSRYGHPGAEVAANLRTSIVRGGEANPTLWIDFCNPRRAESRVWRRNCGPASRVFADAYQGLSHNPSPSDERLGELGEMWTMLGVPQPVGRLSASSDDFGAFTLWAYEDFKKRATLTVPGSVFIIGVDWAPPHTAGHWFNAFKDDNSELWWADAQMGLLGKWPPAFVTEIRVIESVTRPSAVERWRELP